MTDKNTAERIAAIRTPPGSSPAYGFSDVDVERGETDSEYGQGWLDHRAAAIEVARQIDAEQEARDLGSPEHRRLMARRRALLALPDMTDDQVREVAAIDLALREARGPEEYEGMRVVLRHLDTVREENNTLRRDYRAALREIESLRKMAHDSSPTSWLKREREVVRVLTEQVREDRERIGVLNKSVNGLARDILIVRGAFSGLSQILAEVAKELGDEGMATGDIPGAVRTVVQERDMLAAASPMRASITRSAMKTIASDDLAGIMDGPEMMPAEDDDR